MSKEAYVLVLFLLLLYNDALVLSQVLVSGPCLRSVEVVETCVLVLFLLLLYKDALVLGLHVGPLAHHKYK